MLFSRVNRSDPERIFMVVKNSYSTAALAANQWVSWDSVTDLDGVSVTKPSGNTRLAVAGVAVEAVAAGEYGLIQVWGYRNGARMSGGSKTTTAGSGLAAGYRLYMKTAGFCAYGFHKLAAATVVTDIDINTCGVSFGPANTAAKYSSATTWVGKCFIKCL